MKPYILFIQNLTDGDNSWFKQAEEDPYCPSLSKKQRIMGENGLLIAKLINRLKTRFHGLYGHGNTVFLNGRRLFTRANCRRP